MTHHPFYQVDVFADTPYAGNPLAVICNADGLSSATMQSVAHWTNLSETVFLQTPKTPGADYTLRIFTPLQELPFAGHPTLGAAAVWHNHHNQDSKTSCTQHCAGGMIDIKKEEERFYFKAPPLLKSGPLTPDAIADACAALNLMPKDVDAGAHVDNGPGWRALLLNSVEALHRAVPDYAALNGQRLGLIALTQSNETTPAAHVRAFSAGGFEDPVTGSLNAGLAQWMRQSGRLNGDWIVSQGTDVGRDGRVHVTSDDDALWIGGAVQILIKGSITL